MHDITATAFLPAVERAMTAVGGRYDPQALDESYVPLATWQAFLRHLQGELGAAWGPIEQRPAAFAPAHVAVPYAGPEVARRRLPVTFRPTLAAVDGTPVLQVHFNALTL